MARGDYALVEAPDRQPAVDFLTRSSVGPFVDTGLDVDVRRQPGAPTTRERVYLSAHTIYQLAVMVGAVQDNGISALERENLLALGKVEALKENLHERLDALAADLHRIADAADLPAAEPAGIQTL